MADTLSATGGTALIAFFPKYSDALTAISELKDAGFTSSEIGLASSSYSSSSSELLNQQSRPGMEPGAPSDSRLHSSDEGGAWDKIKDFFTGQDESYRGDDDEAYNDTFRHLSVTGDRARYYSTGIQSDGAVVTVRAEAARLEQAKEILSDNDGDLRTSGFEAIGTEARRTVGSSIQSDNEDRSIQLRGEVLRAVKERVQKGEIRLRKDLVTENRTINVPVTREEVIVERVDASGTVPDNESLGDQQEIRIPVSEERVNVTKDKVVTGQVRVQKRTVQDTQQVQDNVQHEELRVEREGDVNLTDESNVADRENVSEPKKPIRKKPAA